MPPLHRSKILHEKSKHLTNWLEFTEIDYQDEAGQHRSWEAVHRRSRNEAAIIVAQLRPIWNAQPQWAAARTHSHTGKARQQVAMLL